MIAIPRLFYDEGTELFKTLKSVEDRHEFSEKHCVDLVALIV